MLRHTELKDILSQKIIKIFLIVSDSLITRNNSIRAHNN